MSTEPPTSPFPLQTPFPPVIISYSTKTDGGRGEQRMWQIANLLKQNGIASFNGKQVETGEDWMQKWLEKMPEAEVCIALLSPSYFQCACKEEIYQTAREGVVILPIIFESPPQLKKGYFGASDVERERGNFVKAQIGNWLPTPDQGLFQDSWSENSAELLRQLKKHLSSDSIGPVEHGMAALTVTKGAKSESNAEGKPSFRLPAMDDNPDGWGPSTLPKQFSDMPYAPFEKRAFLGRMADWSARAEQYRERYRNNNRQATVGNEAFAQEGEDVAGFSLVDTTKAQQQPGWDKGMRGRGRGRGGRFGGRFGGRIGQAQQPMGAEAKFNANFQKKKMPTAPVSKWKKNQQNNQGFRWQDQKPARIRDASVDVRPDWVVQGQITFAELQKCTVEPPAAEDIEACGTLRYYDKQYDRVTPKTERKLERIENAVLYKVSTSEDPVVTRLVEGESAAVSDVRVFATDAVLAVLMAAPRSAFSWDVVVNRVGDRLFLDKRAGSSIDYVTCNETANDFGDEDKESINNPDKLTKEASYVNQNFSQQVLSATPYAFAEPANPFAGSKEEAALAAPVGYKYRKFELGTPPKGDAVDTRVKLLCRCELDGVIKGKQDEDLFLRLYALNEIDAKLVNGIDWRQKLESQRGAVLATELKNNSNKLAKWTLQAMLAGADLIKIGYVSRNHAKDNFNHVILGTQQYKPKEFAQHINLNVANSWGILKAVIDLCLGLDEGKFLLMKDPNKQVIRLYSIPVDAFDAAEPEEEAGEEGAEDDD